MSRGETFRKAAPVAAAGVAGTALLGGATSVSTAAYFARRVLTPDRRRPDDVKIRSIDDGTVTLEITHETRVPGRYGLWLDGGAGHARIGQVLDIDLAGKQVTRELLAVDRGTLQPGPARWNGYYFWDAPDISLGVPCTDVHIESELGPMPAWQVAPEGGMSQDWAVLVHGRGARREECLRAVKPLRDNGFTVLVPMYRNDEGAPAGPDGRYTLGLSEWRDVEAAIAYAIDHGARRIVLGGWSMGGAISLQFVARSELAASVERLFLDGAVVDWGDVLDHHARLNHLPSGIGALARTVMGRSWGRRLTGTREVVDVAQTNWVARADDLHHPIMIIHSVDDEFVPVGPAQKLAAARPDIVRLESWHEARHTKEWNTDPARWEELVAEFVSG